MRTVKMWFDEAKVLHRSASHIRVCACETCNGMDGLREQICAIIDDGYTDDIPTSWRAVYCCLCEEVMCNLIERPDFRYCSGDCLTAANVIAACRKAAE